MVKRLFKWEAEAQASYRRDKKLLKLFEDITELHMRLDQSNVEFMVNKFYEPHPHDW